MEITDMGSQEFSRGFVEGGRDAIRRLRLDAADCLKLADELGPPTYKREAKKIKRLRRSARILLRVAADFEQHYRG